MMETAYWVGLGVLGVVVLLLLMRLLSSSWGEVGEVFIYLLKPQWMSAMDGELTDDNWSHLKFMVVALVSAFLVFEFHRRVGYQFLESLAG